MSMATAVNSIVGDVVAAHTSFESQFGNRPASEEFSFAQSTQTPVTDADDVIGGSAVAAYASHDEDDTPTAQTGLGPPTWASVQAPVSSRTDIATGSEDLPVQRTQSDRSQPSSRRQRERAQTAAALSHRGQATSQRVVPYPPRQTTRRRAASERQSTSTSFVSIQDQASSSSIVPVAAQPSLMPRPVPATRSNTGNLRPIIDMSAPTHAQLPPPTRSPRVPGGVVRTERQARNQPMRTLP